MRRYERSFVDDLDLPLFDKNASYAPVTKI